MKIALSIIALILCLFTAPILLPPLFILIIAIYLMK